jgi:hypothetical protein
MQRLPYEAYEGQIIVNYDWVNISEEEIVDSHSVRSKDFEI